MGVLVELFVAEYGCMVVGEYSGFAVSEQTKAEMWPSRRARLESTRPWALSPNLKRKEKE